MDREHLPTRQWKGSIEGWVVNYLSANAWRTQPEHDFDDLLQEAYILFMVCQERYTHVTEERHFFSLFRRALTNRVNDLSVVRSKRHEQTLYPTGPEGDEQAASTFLACSNDDERGVDHGSGESVADTDLRLDLAGAPEPVAQVAAMLSDPDPLRFRYLRTADGVRQTTNEFLCYLAGVDPTEYNLSRWLRKVLRGEC